jgi:hypothetical protein
MIKEVKPNEIITYRDTQIRAVEDDAPWRCLRCCFDTSFGISECIESTHIIGDCRAEYRTDGKDIRFKIIDE